MAIVPKIESIIEKVVFHLHPSFARPVREVMTPPYQVTEMGWGEFEAGIKIFWKNDQGSTGSKAVTSLLHALKLYEQIPQPAPFDQQMGTDQQPQQAPINVDKPVVSEFYDEVVFTFKNPNDNPFYEALVSLASDFTSTPPNETNSTEHTMNQNSTDGSSEIVTGNLLNKPLWPETYWTDCDQIQVMTAAQNYVDTELNAVKDRILKAESEAMELEKLQKELFAAKAAAKASSSNKGAVATTVSSR